jgi:hypothetical protein
MARTLSETLDNLYTTTWQNMKGSAADQIFDGTPGWFWLKQHDGLEKVIGGRFITEPVRFAGSQNIKYVQKGSSVPLSDQEFLTIAHDVWRYLTDSIVRFGIDDQQNRGKNQIMSLMTAKLDNSRDSLTDEMEKRFCGTAGTNEYNGLLDIVAEDPTADTVHNIASATYTWWRNQYMDYDTTWNSAAPDFTADGDQCMNNMVNVCSKGLRTESPNIIMCGQGVWEAYFETTIEQRRVHNKTLGDAGFQNIEFRGIPMVWSPQIAPTDGGPISATNKGRMYMLNTRYLKFKYDPSMFFDMTEWKSIPEQVQDRVAQIITAGNLMTNRRRAHGVIFDIQ